MKNKTDIQQKLQRSVLAAVAVLVLTAASASAHEINRASGFYFGASVMGTGLDANATHEQDFAINDGGGGLGLRIGWLFNPKFSLELALAAQAHETSDANIVAGLGSFDILAYYHFRGDQHLRPYVKGGFGGYGLGFGEEEESEANLPRIQGAGLVFGGGIEYFLGDHFSLGADFTHHIINYERKELDLGDGLIQGNELDETGSASSIGLFFTVYI